MSIFDFYVAVFHEVVADFIFYYIALKKYCSDDDKGENDDD